MDYKSQIKEIEDKIYLEDGLAVDKTTNYVGIGTTSPSAPLQVAVGTNLPVATAANGTLSVGSISSTSIPSILGRVTSSVSGLYLVASGVNTNTNGDMVFSVRENDNSTFATLTNPAYKFQHFTTDLVTILRNGNVGIGTTTPAEKLEVAGDIRLSTNGRSLRFDTLNEASSAMVRCENDYELSIFTVRGSAGFGTFGNSDIRLGFGTAHSAAQTKLYINPSGNIGIGTTSPAHKLHVDGAIKLTSNPSVTGDNGSAHFWNQSGVGPTIAGANFQVRTNGTLPALYINQSQNVGIGTTSPSRKLEVNGDAYIAGEFLATTNGLVRINQYDNGLVGAGEIALWAAGGTGWGVGDGLGRIRFYTNDASGIGARDVARIEALSDSGNGTTTTVSSSALAFYTSASNANVVEAVRINSAGLVGIGTNAPNEKLDVYGNIKIGTTANSNFLNRSDAHWIQYNGGATTNNTYIRVASVNAASIGKTISLWTDAVNRFEVKANGDSYFTGNLGIGATSPVTKLDVRTDNFNYGMAIIQDGGTGYAPASILLEARQNASRGSGLYHYNTQADISWYSGTLYDNTDKWGIAVKTGETTWNSDVAQAVYTKFIVDSSGRVGIGTTNPAVALHINNSVNSSSGPVEVLRLTTTTNSTRGLAVNLFNSGGINDSGIDFNAQHTSGATLTFSTNSTERMRIDSNGNVGIGTILPSSRISVASPTDTSIVYSGHYSSSNQSNFLEIGILANDGYLKLKNSGVVTTVHLNSDGNSYLNGGNVGIGTTTPAQKLEVRSDVDGDVVLARFSNRNGNASTGAYIGFATGYDAEATIGAKREGAENDSSLIFSPMLNQVVTERMRITSAGNVGIGTTNPSQKLEVVGIVKSSGASNSLMFENRTNASNTWEWYSQGNTGSGFAGLYKNHNTPGTPFVVTDAGSVGIGTTSPNGKLQVDGDIYVNGADKKIMNYNGAIDYGTLTNNSIRFNTDGTEKVRISGNGNLGIGTTDPSCALEVNGNIGFTGDSNRYLYMPDTYQGTGSIYIQAGFGSSQAGGAIRLLGHNAPNYTGGDVEIGLSTKGDFMVNTYIGGSRLFTVKQNGNVGIGTTSPVRQLEVKNSGDAWFRLDGASSYFDFLMDGNLRMFNAGGERMRITSGGNIGIGLTNPAAKLDVNGASITRGALYVTTGMETAGNFSSCQVKLDATNTIDTTGWQGISFDTSTSANYGWSIGANRSSDGRGSFRFYEHNNSNAGVERFTLLQDGNIGIGTPSPGYPLHVVKNQSSDTAITITNAGSVTSTTSMSFSINPSGTPQGWFRGYRDGTASTEIGFAQALLFTGTIQATKATRMVIDADGDVGINVTNPTQKLHVDGNVLANNLYLQLNGNIQKVGSGSTLKIVNSNAITEMFVNGSGNLGIGIQNDTALAKIHVAGDFGSNYTSDANTGPLFVHNTSTNTSTYGIKVKVNAGTAGTPIAFWQSSTLRGYISVSSSGTTYNSSSDYRLKENVVPLQDSVERLMSLKPKMFNFIEGDGTTIDGFLAHEVKDYVPSAVQGEKDEVDNDGNPIYQAIDHSRLVPLLTAALQEAMLRIQVLEERINNL